MTIHHAILHGERSLKENGIENARWQAERIVLLALQQPRAKIYADFDRELTSHELSRFMTLLRKRAQHYPLAYLEGTQEFFGREFVVNESVLIPRPETEEIIRAIFNLAIQKNPRILDLGSGSGNIAVTLALELSGSFVVALEISRSAIAVICKNSKGQIHVVRGNFRALCFQDSFFDLVTANLPYVESSDFAGLPSETRWEPATALLVDSLEDTYLEAMKQSYRVLRPGGHLLMEIGFGQSARLQSIPSLFKGLKLLSIRPDGQGIPRVMVLQKQIHPLESLND